MKKITSPIVSVDWLNNHISDSNLIILDATMKKVNLETNEFKNIKIKGSQYLDIKTIFSDVNAPYPNTMLSEKKFQEQARKLGINKNSFIVVYDAIGIYSSSRVWWMFKAMGHKNIVVLNGGLPEWIKQGYLVEKNTAFKFKKGNFIANYDSDYFSDFKDVLSATNNSTIILDARSPDRFNGSKPEPREGLRTGHIPTSKNIHYADLFNENLIKSEEELKNIFNKKITKNDKIIFSCGSGITACILALGTEILEYKNVSIYDGSWTEWGSKHDLPIEK